jgi:hypothetical protein
LGILAIAHLSDVDQKIINDSYFNHHKRQLDFVDEEIKRLESYYGISIDERTTEVLKQWRTESAYNQMKAVNRAFESARPVSMDTIILSKVIFNNMKRGNWYGMGRRSIESWHYPQPIHIQEQIGKTEFEGDKAKELVDLLKDQIKYWNCNDFDYSDWLKMSDYEAERIFFAERIPSPIIAQLRSVRDSLMNNPDFVKNQYELPEVVKR